MLLIIIQKSLQIRFQKNKPKQTSLQIDENVSLFTMNKYTGHWFKIQLFFCFTCTWNSNSVFQVVFIKKIFTVFSLKPVSLLLITCLNRRLSGLLGCLITWTLQLLLCWMEREFLAEFNSHVVQILEVNLEEQYKRSLPI